MILKPRHWSTHKLKSENGISRSTLLFLNIMHVVISSRWANQYFRSWTNNFNFPQSIFARNIPTGWVLFVICSSSDKTDEWFGSMHKRMCESFERFLTNSQLFVPKRWILSNRRSQLGQRKEEIFLLWDLWLICGK